MARSTKKAVRTADRMPKEPVEVFFATNRFVEGSDSKPSFGTGFHSEGPHYLRYGRALVQAPAKWDYDVEKDGFKVVSKSLAKEAVGPEVKTKEVLGSEQIFETLRRTMIETESDALIYLHGFANTMDSALERAAELKLRFQFDSERPLNVFAFCWPSDGEMVPYLSYYSDRDDAQISGIAIARAMLKLREWLIRLSLEQAAGGKRRFCNQRIHLVAHSMGNYAFRHAVQSMCGELNGRLEPIFDQVFLMASDEDDDTFEKAHKLGVLPELARAIHVYYSTSDVPLDQLADVTKMLPDRLGTQGPRNKDGLHRKINLVDCTSVDWTGSIAHGWHQYYRLRREVYEDVRQILSGILPRDVSGREFLPEERAYRILPLADRGKQARSVTRRLGPQEFGRRLRS